MYHKVEQKEKGSKLPKLNMTLTSTESKKSPEVINKRNFQHRMLIKEVAREFEPTDTDTPHSVRILEPEYPLLWPARENGSFFTKRIRSNCWKVLSNAGKKEVATQTQLFRPPRMRGKGYGPGALSVRNNAASILRLAHSKPKKRNIMVLLPPLHDILSSPVLLLFLEISDGPD